MASFPVSTQLAPIIGKPTPGGSRITYVNSYKDLPSKWGAKDSDDDTTSESDEEHRVARMKVQDRRARARRKQKRKQRREEKAAAAAAKAKEDAARAERLRKMRREKRKLNRKHGKRGSARRGADASGSAGSDSTASEATQRPKVDTAAAPRPDPQQQEFAKTLGIGSWPTPGVVTLFTPEAAQPPAEASSSSGEDRDTLRRRRRRGRAAAAAASATRRATARARALAHNRSDAGFGASPRKARLRGAGQDGESAQLSSTAVPGLGQWDGTVGARMMKSAAAVASEVRLSHNTLQFWARHPELAPPKAVAGMRQRFMRYHDPARGGLSDIGSRSTVLSGSLSGSLSTPALPRARAVAGTPGDGDRPGAPHGDTSGDRFDGDKQAELAVPSWSFDATQSVLQDSPLSSAQAAEATGDTDGGTPRGLSTPRRTRRVQSATLADRRSMALEDGPPQRTKMEAKDFVTIDDTVLFEGNTGDAGSPASPEQFHAAPSSPAGVPTSPYTAVEQTAARSKLEEAVRTSEAVLGPQHSSTLRATLQLETPAAKGAVKPLARAQSASVLTKSRGITFVPDAMGSNPVSMPEPLLIPPVLHAAMENTLKEVSAPGAARDADAEAVKRLLAPSVVWLRHSQARHRAALPFQSAYRMFVWRRWFLQRHNAAITIQCAARTAWARHLTKHLAVAQRDAVRETVITTVATTIFQAMRSELHLYRLLQTMRRCFGAWKRVAAVARVASQLHFAHVSADALLVLREWAVVARTRGRDRRCVRTQVARHNVRLLRRVVAGWRMHARLRRGVMRMLRRLLSQLKGRVWLGWVEGFRVRRAASVTIQSTFRGWKLRHRWSAATSIESVVRGRAARVRAAKLRFARDTNAARRLQRVFRGHRSRARFGALREALLEHEAARQANEDRTVARAVVVAEAEAVLYCDSAAGKAEVAAIVKRIKQAQAETRAWWDTRERARLDARERLLQRRALARGDEPPPSRTSARGRVTALKKKSRIAALSMKAALTARLKRPARPRAASEEAAGDAAGAGTRPTAVRLRALGGAVRKIGGRLFGRRSKKASVEPRTADAAGESRESESSVEGGAEHKAEAACDAATESKAPDAADEAATESKSPDAAAADDGATESKEPGATDKAETQSKADAAAEDGATDSQAADEAQQPGGEASAPPSKEPGAGSTASGSRQRPGETDEDYAFRLEDEAAAAERRMLELRLQFDMFDIDCTGTLDRDELRELVGGVLGVKQSPEQVDALIKRLDTDGSGDIAFDEVLVWYNEQRATRKRGPASLFRGAQRSIARAAGVGAIRAAARRIVTSRMKIRAAHQRREQFRKDDPPHPLWLLLHPPPAKHRTAYSNRLFEDPLLPTPEVEPWSAAQEKKKALVAKQTAEKEAEAAQRAEAEAAQDENGAATSKPKKKKGKEGKKGKKGKKKKNKAGGKKKKKETEESTIPAGAQGTAAIVGTDASARGGAGGAATDTKPEPELSDFQRKLNERRMGALKGDTARARLAMGASSRRVAPML